MSTLQTKIKINYCSEEKLRILQGIGAKRARNIIEHRNQHGYFLTVEDLEKVPLLSKQLASEICEKVDWSFNGNFVAPPTLIKGDARDLQDLIPSPIDVIITSPPYWKKRDYGHQNQLGQETTAKAYVKALLNILDSWKPLLYSHGSVFINIGDTYRNRALVGIPALFEVGLRERGWHVANKIIWAKGNGIPEPKKYRLANRNEIILHLAKNKTYFTDLYSLSQYLGQNSNPGDVWQIPQKKRDTDHLAPFPYELVRRIIEFACPEHVCNHCNQPFKRNLVATADLDVSRPQAKRALELFAQAGLTKQHFDAIRAVGISDAGKGKRFQIGANSNAEKTKALALEAKEALGGYFREFTFGPKKQAGWEKCNCPLNTRPGIVVDPFMGSGTTPQVAYQTGRKAFGVDLMPISNNRS